MAAFMQASDYVQWHGFYDLLKDREEIEDIAKGIRGIRQDKASKHWMSTSCSWHLHSSYLWNL